MLDIIYRASLAQLVGLFYFVPSLLTITNCDDLRKFRILSNIILTDIAVDCGGGHICNRALRATTTQGRETGKEGHLLH